MTSIDPIRDIRFEGMDIPQLQEWITQVKQGRGTESMQSAVRALDECVQVVVDLDDTLRRELGKLQIAWEGNAGDLAAAATQQQAVFMSDAPDPLRASAQSVDEQGRGYESARHTLPNSDELRHKQSENAVEWAGGAFGYESDYDKEAKQIDANKKAAQAALASYRDTSVEQANTYQPLPEMPPATVTAQSASPSGMASSGLGSGVAVAGVVGGSAQPGVGSPGVGTPGSPVPGGGFVVGGGDGRTGERAVPRPGDRPADRKKGEIDKGGEADPTPEATGDSGGVSAGTILGIAAGGAAVAGIGAYAASRVLGGRGAPVPAGGPAPGGSVARGGSVGGGPGDTTAGKAAGNTPGSRPGAGSLMGPAATRGEKRSEDAEHENKYVAEETPFDDERLVAPPVLGGDERNDDPPAEAAPEPKKQD
ncbi:PPE family protein [Saccharopolyspora kobensis]|uniref:PPE family protein n=2 Tax=Saccharopolyspora kobensis TaxID=146035 RepID=A0A1H6BQK1_9PSEU|nr:PPE domain-containing protein [Saccharopolyspora kobensis]SEG62697.1 PPE family protein [Saccharopolyspora kobensis]SFE84208.1 PPE family protein [Saccharopolyspora kobensis]